MITTIDAPPHDILRRLWEYLDEEMPEAEAEDMRQHLAECPTCGPHAAFERRLLDRIAAVRPEYGELASVRARVAAALAIELPRSE